MEHCYFKILYNHLFTSDRNQSGLGPCGKKLNQQQERGRACRHRAVTSHMHPVTLQDSAADMVSIAPAQEQSSQTDMQEGQ